MHILKCPHCKSTNVTLDTGGQTGKYICKDCGYIGSLIIEKRVNNRNKKKFLRFPMETDKKRKKGGNMCFKICAKKVTWANWQLGILKIACIAIGILLGAYLVGFWKKIIWLVWVVVVVFVIWTCAVWFNSMKKKK